MPRAFLITHRRYNAVDMEHKELSPERSVSIAEPASELQVSDNSSECPDELYNLTKLAEVSLAAAAGQLFNHRHLSTNAIPNSDAATKPDQSTFTYTHKLFDKSTRAHRNHVIKTEKDQPKQLTLCNLPLPNPPPSSTTSRRNSSDSGEITSSTPHPSHHETHEHECSDCGKRYSTSSNLARHRQTHRSPADKKARRCPHCDKIYVSMPAFSMHVRTHNQGCKCHFCGKCFSRPWLLQGHIRTHTGEKPFKCNICNKAFADKSNLRAHVQTHSNTKPHICGRCGKAFALKSYLYKHEESSCMRINGRQESSREGSPDQGSSSPTPVIVPLSQTRPTDSVIKSPCKPYASPERPIYRSTVISPNPERILYATSEHPSVILSSGRFSSASVTIRHHQEQPMDFSPSSSRDMFDRQTAYAQTSERSTGYAIGLAIAV